MGEDAVGGEVGRAGDLDVVGRLVAGVGDCGDRHEVHRVVELVGPALARHGAHGRDLVAGPDGGERQPGWIGGAVVARADHEGVVGGRPDAPAVGERHLEDRPRVVGADRRHDARRDREARRQRVHPVARLDLEDGLRAVLGADLGVARQAAGVRVDPLHGRVGVGVGSLGDQVVDVVGPVLDGGVADLGARQGHDLDHRGMERVGGVDRRGAVVRRNSAGDIGLVLLDRQIPDFLVFYLSRRGFTHTQIQIVIVAQPYAVTVRLRVSATLEWNAH